VNNNTAIVERVNRTIREMIDKHIQVTGKNKYIDKLQEIVMKYN